MIDYVRLRTTITIPHTTFKRKTWHKKALQDGTFYYWYSFRDVYLRYYPHTENLLIDGKILMLLYDTQVLNFDDIYGLDTEAFIDDINEYFNKLFTTPIIDIRSFHVTRIDYCFNVHTEHVDTYIDFFNRAFKLINSSMRKNYTLENGLSGSSYIKTASDYKNNSLKNYTLNFYNKADRLSYLENLGCHIHPEDYDHADNILRLEAQCGPEMVKFICKSNNLQNTFCNLFNDKIAVQAIETVYKRIFKGDRTLDYFTYEKAKNTVKMQSARDTLYSLSTNHRITGKKYDTGRKHIKTCGIYPYALLPKSKTLPMLENPIKLIHQKIASMTETPALH